MKVGLYSSNLFVKNVDIVKGCLVVIYSDWMFCRKLLKHHLLNVKEVHNVELVISKDVKIGERVNHEL
jgi:precorrin-4 methylase